MCGRKEQKASWRGKKKREKKSALPRLEGTGLESSEAHPRLAVPTPPPPRRRSWAELTAKGSSPGSTLLPRLLVPQSPATATQAFCLSDLQLPGYRSYSVYSRRKSDGVEAPGQEVSSLRQAPRNCLLCSPPRSSRLRPDTGAQGWTLT